VFWETLQQDFWFYLINLLAFATAIIISWLWTRYRWLAQVAQLKTEIALLKVQQGDQLSVLEDAYKAKEEHVRFVLQDFLQQLENGDAKMLQARRNELSNIFILEYRKRFYHFVRLAAELYEENEKKHRIVIENHILPFLQLAGDLLEVINQPNVLALSQTPRLQYQYQDFDFVFDFMQRFLGWTDFGLKKAIKQHKTRLNF
jgi:hypothetical protein